MAIDGKPIPADSEVVFFNKDKGATLGTKVDSLGQFTLIVADAKIGIPTGHYQVAIRPAPPPAVKMGSADYQKQMQGGAAASAPVQSPILPKFKDFETSKVEFDVTAGANKFDFDLSKY